MAEDRLKGRDGKERGKKKQKNQDLRSNADGLSDFGRRDPVFYK